MKMATAGDIVVYDRRKISSPARSFALNRVESFSAFQERISDAIGSKPDQEYVICTPTRNEVTENSFSELDDLHTVYILNDVQQELPTPTKIEIEFIPHYDTLVKSGMYEYYASEGHNPLPFAFAELIDNSLAATASNSENRQIELHLLLDEQSPDKSSIYILDNGCGMTAKQLNDWAIYRLSKFSRKEKHIGYGCSEEIQQVADKSTRTNSPFVRRSLNSDISYFGVGGKQAIFFIGNSTRMITKPSNTKDVHELCISKKEFEKREKNKQSIYKGFIHNRKPGDFHHVLSEDEHLREIIMDEVNKDSFTCVVINGISPEHVQFSKQNYKIWCQQLAHIYHYYIHGPDGNNSDKKTGSSSQSKNINIEIKLYLKNHLNKIANLRDVKDDLPSQLNNSSSATFEFRAIVEGTGVVEGMLRYHPFLYDHETFPTDNFSPVIEEEHDYGLPTADLRPARGKRPIFECYWNGRLIPYTCIEEFDWCSAPKKSRTIPLECFNRISGVVWANDKFQVSTNKLTFMDLEVKLRDKNTIFCKVIDGQERRGNIDKHFIDWLKDCHENCDKQVKFGDFQRVVTRPELHRNKQYPWAEYLMINWDGKIFKQGQLVRSVKSTGINSQMCGTVQRFLLHGDHDGDTYATGGEVEILQEPQSIYDNVFKVFPLLKLDRMASIQTLNGMINEEEEKLPHRIILHWPEGDEVKNNYRLPAGKTIGAIKVEIANCRGDLISKLAGSSQRKLLVELRIVWHSPSGDVTVVQHVCQHAKNWPYWFRKMENIKNLGSHTLILQAILHETGTHVLCGKSLPSAKVNFVVVEAEPEKFSVGVLDGPFRVGVPFSIPLEFQDKFGNPTKPTSAMKPNLEADGLKLILGGTVTKSTTLYMHDIRAIGKVDNNTGKNFGLTVIIPQLESGFHSQNLKIRLLPGPPEKINVDRYPEIVENGSSVSFDVQVNDIGGNPSIENKAVIVCNFSSSQQEYRDVNLPKYSSDLSKGGHVTLTGNPIKFLSLKDPLTVKATFSIQNFKGVADVTKEFTIVPSKRVTTMKLTYFNEDTKSTVEVIRGKDILVPCGYIMTGIELQVYDEGGREVELSASLMSKLKLNWMSSAAQKNRTSGGKLPDIVAPKMAKTSQYCHVALSTDSSLVDFDFTIKTTCGQPTTLKVKLTGNNRVKVGSRLQSDLLVSLQDQYGNQINKTKKESMNDLKDLTVISDLLDYSKLEKALEQNSGFIFTGLYLKKEIQLGRHELCVQWRNLTDYVKIEVTPGPPSSITYVGYEANKTYTVYTDKVMRDPLIVQLCDESGNKCDEPNIKIQLMIDDNLKIMPALHVIKSDTKGRADYGFLSVSTKNNMLYGSCTSKLCDPLVNKCRGTYAIYAKAFYGRNTTVGDPIFFHVACDPERPSAIHVDYDERSSYVAGDSLDEFRVTVKAEDGSTIKSVKPSDVKMKIWKSQEKQTEVSEYEPSDSKPSDSMNTFYFRNSFNLEHSGQYSLQFACTSVTPNLTSETVNIGVVPNKPVKFVPSNPTSSPVISNTPNPAKRCLVKSLKFVFRDKYDNITGKNLNGGLGVQIVCPAGTAVAANQIPRMVGNVTSIEVPIIKGQAGLQNLLIQENTPGIDGKQYILRFTPLVTSINVNIPPYDVPFLFCNDVQKQEKMMNLSKERDQLRRLVDGYKSVFNTFNELRSTLQTTRNNIRRQVQNLKSQLRIRADNVDVINELLRKKQTEVDEIIKSNRRTCQLPPAPDDDGVLGKIGYLGVIADSNAAHVLSWHMASDMDCIVTYTIDKARELYHCYGNKYQVLSLNTVYRKNLPNWSKPLPHTRIRNFQPSGDPIYARNLIIFPKEPENCKIVFGMLLGDTIILDTIDDATRYREEVVKHMYCPTLLTRTGDRIRSNGKFGGAQNKAPPLDKLKGAVFGEPVPDTYDETTAFVEKLQNLRSSMMKEEQMSGELEEHCRKEEDNETKQQYKEWKEAEKKLDNVEKQLGLSSSSSSEDLKTPRVDESSVAKTTPTQMNRRSKQSTPQSIQMPRTSPRGLRRTGTPAHSPMSRKRIKK